MIAQKVKAIRIDNGQWIDGFYGETYYTDEFGTLHLGQIMATVNNKYVIPETVCRPTGKKDMNGIDIFQGDILKAPSMSGDYNCIVKWSDLYA